MEKAAGQVNFNMGQAVVNDTEEENMDRNAANPTEKVGAFIYGPLRTNPPPPRRTSYKFTTLYFRLTKLSLNS